MSTQAYQTANDRETEYFALAREREAIRRKKAAGWPWPWTDDRVLRDWAICNVHREHDRTTVWFREHVRQHLTGWPVVEATIAFRWFNRIETGTLVLDLLTDGWDRAEAERRLAPLRDADEQLWGGAYRIRGDHSQDKLTSILNAIETARTRLRSQVPQWGGSLREAWLDLCQCHLLGPLTSYEIVSDLRWTSVLAHAADIDTWASIGSGCANGLEWVMTGHVGTHDSSPGEMPRLVPLMQRLLALSRDPAYWPAAYDRWEMREVEHWACEVAKIIKARSGASLKRRYRPALTRSPLRARVPAACRQTAVQPSLFARP